MRRRQVRSPDPSRRELVLPDRLGRRGEHARLQRRRSQLLLTAVPEGSGYAATFDVALQI